MEKIFWMDNVRNLEMLGTARKKWRVLDIIKGRKRNRLGHCMRQTQGNVLTERPQGLINTKRTNEDAKFNV